MVEYRVNDDAVTAEELANLFRASGIRRPADDLPRLERMLRGANVVVTARSARRLVGIARALTDYAYCCYLSDLAVDAAHQRQGIGRALLQRLRSALSEEVAIILGASPAAMCFYPRVGFSRMDNAWIIRRAR